jgi:recombination protein RecT
MSDTPRPQLGTPRATAGNRELVELPLDQAIEAFTPQLVAALPDNIPVRRFKRIVLTAINQNASLARCDRHSLFLAAVKCAQDGLYPDGREAALVPYNNIVQYIPMVTGLRRLMAGEIRSAMTEVVYANDHFRQLMGERAQIEHEPPPLGQDRGEPIGAYAIIRLKSGDAIREVMPKAEIERIRNDYSHNTRADAPWRLHWGEMARKTVLRRAAKQVAFSPEIERVFSRGDDEGDSSVSGYLSPIIDVTGAQSEPGTASTASDTPASTPARRRGRPPGPRQQREPEPTSDAAGVEQPADEPAAQPQPQPEQRPQIDFEV